MPVPEEPEESRQYMRLANLLRSQINDGTLRAGTPAPSLTSLSERYGIARGTARKAIRLLESEGLLRRMPGLAYCVTKQAPLGRSSPSAESMSESECRLWCKGVRRNTEDDDGLLADVPSRILRRVRHVVSNDLLEDPFRGLLGEPLVTRLCCLHATVSGELTRRDFATKRAAR